MTTLDTPRCSVAPFTADDQAKIREELAYLLGTSHFTGSKRYPAFLKWVVEATLAGRSSDLKERTIGVELFGKRPDYDTSSDTIVRFTAGEVRKRLVLAYLQSERSPLIQIGLPAGSYIPEFVHSEPIEKTSPSEEEVTDPISSHHVEVRRSTEPAATREFAVGKSKPWIVGIAIFAVAAVLVLVLLTVRGYASQNDSALDRFWQPLRGSGSSVIIATGAVIPSKESTFGLTPSTTSDRYPYISLASAATVASVGGVLGQRNIAYSVQPSARVTLTDMIQHPIVLIGTFNNTWTLRLLENLRFGVTNKHEPGVTDANDPNQVWRPSWSQGEGSHDRLDDYAIVARYQDKLTQNTVVLLAGLEKNGTETAAQFVTDRRYLDQLDRTQPRNWMSKNIEIVLRAKVVEGRSGAPEVVAVHTW